MEKDADATDTLTPRGPPYCITGSQMKILCERCLNLHMVRNSFPSLTPRPVIMVKYNFDDGHDTNTS